MTFAEAIGNPASLPLSMATRRLADYASSSDPVFRLPHPYLTAYYAINGESPGTYQLKSRDQSSAGTPVPTDLQGDRVFFTEPEGLKSSDRPDESNNTPWARARRSPLVNIHWSQELPPTFAQLWLAVYAVFTIQPSQECFRLRLFGFGADALSTHLKAVSLAIDHPRPSETQKSLNELVVLRGAFWQGAGSPFGARPVWVPEERDADQPRPLSSYPLAAVDYTLTNDPPSVLCWHPRRPVKPRPGSVIYSRYIPHLKETFSMVALDYQNKEHLDLFHQWQNDPRVSQGWDQTGTLGQHREYLQQTHEDPHQIAILARFDETYFAYFEVYWAKASLGPRLFYIFHKGKNQGANYETQEDRLGPYYTAGDYDRGRHSLVGDVRFRGPHRVSAWWSSLMHYLYLDDPRTTDVVGEPKYTNTPVLMYDLMHGFGVEKFVDLPFKRSVFMRCSRERFFQLCPLDENEKVMGGTLLGLVPKL